MLPRNMSRGSQNVFLLSVVRSILPFVDTWAMRMFVLTLRIGLFINFFPRVDGKIRETIKLNLLCKFFLVRRRCVPEHIRTRNEQTRMDEWAL